MVVEVLVLFVCLGVLRFFIPIENLILLPVVLFKLIFNHFLRQSTAVLPLLIFFLAACIAALATAM